MPPELQSITSTPLGFRILGQRHALVRSPSPNRPSTEKRTKQRLISRPMGAATPFPTHFDAEAHAIELAAAILVVAHVGRTARGTGGSGSRARHGYRARRRPASLARRAAWPQRSTTSGISARVSGARARGSVAGALIPLEETSSHCSQSSISGEGFRGRAALPRPGSAAPCGRNGRAGCRARNCAGG